MKRISKFFSVLGLMVALVVSLIMNGGITPVHAAIPTNGVYTTDSGALALNVELVGVSINDHTRPYFLWVQNSEIYIAVKSTHHLDGMTLEGAASTGSYEHLPVLSTISIDDHLNLDPAYQLNGNTKDSRWTIFSFPMSLINVTGTYSFFVDGIGDGHDVGGEFEVIVPTAQANLMKTWVDGPMSPVDVQLYRKVGQSGTPFEVGDPITLTPNQQGFATYQWLELPLTNTIGQYWTYFITEADPGQGYSVNFSSEYDSELMTYTFTLRNTYTAPRGDIVATKEWDGGVKTEVSFQLYRKVAEGEPITVGEPVMLDGVIDENELVPWEYTWMDLELKTMAGLDYIYFVREVMPPEKFMPDDTDDLVVTNTFMSPLTDVMAEKVWSGGALRPEVTFQLYRFVGDEEPEMVGPEVMLDGVVDDNEMVAWKYTWEELPTHRHADGLPYEYYVVEVDVPENYMPDDTDDLVVTNTFESPLADVVANKVWVGGSLRPEVTFQLYRRVGTEVGVAVGSPVKLDGVIDANELTAWTYTWKSLPTHRQADGLAFVYYVIETGAVTNYVPDAVDDLTVTNTFVSPLIDVTMTKVWLNVTANFPTVQIQLFRNGVAHLAPVSLVNGATGYTWEDLAQFDPNGVAYVYTVDEVAIPTGYLKQVVGMQITNVFVVLPDTGGDLPDTGTTDNTMYIIGGVSIALIGVLAIILVKRKKS